MSTSALLSMYGGLLSFKITQIIIIKIKKAVKLENL